VQIRGGESSVLSAVSRKDCPAMTLTESFLYHKIIFIKHFFIGGSDMTKANLIEKMAAASGCTKACACKALDGAIAAITKAVKRGIRFLS